MAKKIKSYQVKYKSNDPTNPKFKDGGKASLKLQDWVEIDLDDNWPAGTTIDSLTFYNNVVVGGEDQKNESSQLGAWTSSEGNGTGLAGIFDCSISGNVLTVVDAETLADNSEMKYWFSVTGTIGGTNPAESWSVDPELINKGRSG